MSTVTVHNMSFVEPPKNGRMVYDATTSTLYFVEQFSSVFAQEKYQFDTPIIQAS